MHKGDLLAQIDPRPNQAAYDQAVATRAKDAAQLRQRAARPGALQGAAAAGPGEQADRRHAAARWSISSTAQLQVDQALIDNARTQLDYTRITLAHRRPHRHPARRSGQHRACGRHHRHRRGHPGAADQRHFHAARGDPGRRRRGARGGPGARSRRCRATAARSSIRARSALIDNQIDQATGTHQAQGDVRQRAQHALARPIRQRAGAGAHRPQRAARCPPARGAARAGRPVHLRRQGRLDRRGAAAEDRRSRAARMTAIIARASRSTSAWSPATNTACSRARAVRVARRRGAPASRHEHLRAVRPAADRHLAADGRHLAGRAWWSFRCCRWRRCRRSTFRPSRSSASLPGASPETMASSVATPLEYQFAQIPGCRR